MTNINNQRGSVLVITIAFVLFFTLMGFASIHTAGVQNEWAEKMKFSDQAFWLADGNIDRARNKRGLGTSLVEPSGCTPSKTTNCVKTTNDSYVDFNGVTRTYSHRWKADSSWVNNLQAREIEAIISKYDISNAITASGTVNQDCAPQGSSQIGGPCEQNQVISFDSVFGVSKSYVTGLPGVTNYNNSNYTTSYTGISYVSSSNTSTFNYTGGPNTLSGSGILIIECTHGNDPCVVFNGGSFQGIVWIIGDVRIQGNPDIQGTLFVQGTVDSNVSGNSEVVFNETNIENAANLIPGFTTGTLKIVSWKEI